MNLIEFIRKNDIKCKDGEEFVRSPEFFKIRQFERTCHTIFAVPFLEPQTYEIKEFDVVLKGSVREKWDRKEKRTKRQFFIDRTLRYPKQADSIGTIEDAVDAGKTIDQALESLELEKQWFEFFKRYDLIDAGRYWLNRDLCRCFVDDGKVVVIDSHQCDTDDAKKTGDRRHRDSKR
jgi:hypothetical protein